MPTRRIARELPHVPAAHRLLEHARQPAPVVVVNVEPTPLTIENNNYLETPTVSTSSRGTRQSDRPSGFSQLFSDDVWCCEDVDAVYASR